MENSLLDQDRINSILKYAHLAPEGYFAEAGVYKGGICKLLGQQFPNRTILGFDTFEGLPADYWKPLEKHRPKDFQDTSIEEVYKFISLPNVRLIKGLFPDSATEFADDVFAFVHLDLDFYQSTKLALEWFWPKMVKGGWILLDDIDWHMCPGVRKALDEFGLPVTMTTLSQGLLCKD